MNRVQKSILKQCLENKNNFLNQWEKSFIKNLNENFQDKELTKDQNKTLNKIQKKCL